MSNLTGWITTTSRRYATLVAADGRLHQAISASRHLELCVGDQVTYVLDNPLKKAGDTPSDATISAILPRKSCLKRRDSRTTKELAANLDLLLIIAAPPPLFSSALIDRVLTSAAQQKIDSTLVLNKVDLLQGSDSREFLEPYRALDLPLLEVSAKERIAKEVLLNVLRNPSLERVALIGVSGVGKSSLLSLLIDDSSIRTQDVSIKTGQGRQTTTQAVGYLFERTPLPPLLLIDLPGIQNYGISHLSKEEVRAGFPEFIKVGRCQFADCWHLKEPQCTVTAALKEGRVSQSRYRSYCEMLEEIERNKPY